MSLSHLNTASADVDDLGDLIATIDEMVESAGVAAVVRAALNSRAAPGFNKLGGDATLRIAQVVIREIVYSENPQLAAEVIAVAAGIILEDKMTMTRLAVKHGITKQAISKKVLEFADSNGLPPSSFMRAARDRVTYSMTNRPRGA